MGKKRLARLVAERDKLNRQITKEEARAEAKKLKKEGVPRDQSPEKLEA